MPYILRKAFDPSGQEGLVGIRGAKTATELPGSCHRSNSSVSRRRAAVEHRVGRGAGPACQPEEVLLQDIRVEQCESKGGVW